MPIKEGIMKWKSFQWPTKRVLSAVVAIFIAVGSAGVVTITAAAPAAAESSSVRTAQYWWPHNGCTWVSDAPAGVSFTYACNHHDGCYALRWSKDRATCDAWFYNDMIRACQTAPWWRQGACDDMALDYYLAVRALGWYYWNSNSQLVRINTPMTTG
jgi:hypothetical protein